MKTKMTSLVRTCDLQEVKKHFEKGGVKVTISKVPGHIEAPGTKLLTITTNPRTFLMLGANLKGYGSWGLNDNLHVTCAGIIKRTKRAFKNGISFNEVFFYNLSELKKAVELTGMNFISYKKKLQDSILKRTSFASSYPGAGQDRIHTFCN